MTTKNQKNVVVEVEVYADIIEATEALSQGKGKPGSTVTNEKAAKVISSKLLPYTSGEKGELRRVLLAKSVLCVVYYNPKLGHRIDFIYMPELDKSITEAIIEEDTSHVS